MTSNEKNNYLGINDHRHGPLSDEDIRAMYVRGEITGDTKFFRVGMKEWGLLSDSGLIILDEIPPLPPDDDILIISSRECGRRAKSVRLSRAFSAVVAVK